MSPIIIEFNKRLGTLSDNNHMRGSRISGKGVRILTVFMLASCLMLSHRHLVFLTT